MINKKISSKRNASNKKVKMASPERSLQSYNKISEKAYFIWESNGRPENSTMDNWLQAERELNLKSP